MREWTVAHSLRGFEIHCREVKPHLKALEVAAESLDSALGHLFCDPPKVLYDIPVGKRRYDHSLDDEPFLENSVAMLINRAFNSVVGLCYKYSTPIIVIPISDQQGKILWRETGVE